MVQAGSRLDAIAAVRSAYARTFLIGPSEQAVVFYLTDATSDVAAIDKAQRVYDGITEGAWAGYDLGTEGGRFARLVEAGYTLRLNTGADAAALLDAAIDTTASRTARKTPAQQADIDSRMAIICQAKEIAAQRAS